MVCGSCKYEKRLQLDSSLLDGLGDLELKLDAPISRAYTPAQYVSAPAQEMYLERRPQDLY